jgi:hypothetical protein
VKAAEVQAVAELAVHLAEMVADEQEAQTVQYLYS